MAKVSTKERTVILLLRASRSSSIHSSSSAAAPSCRLVPLDRAAVGTFASWQQTWAHTPSPALCWIDERRALMLPRFGGHPNTTEGGLATMPRRTRRAYAPEFRRQMVD